MVVHTPHRRRDAAVARGRAEPQTFFRFPGEQALPTEPPSARLASGIDAFTLDGGPAVGERVATSSAR